MSDDFVQTHLIKIANDLGELRGMMQSHVKTTEEILDQAKTTNGRLRIAEDDIKYMKPIVQDYAAVRIKVLIGLFSLLAVGYAGGAGAGDIVAQVIAGIIK